MLNSGVEGKEKAKDHPGCIWYLAAFNATAIEQKVHNSVDAAFAATQVMNV